MSQVPVAEVAHHVLVGAGLGAFLALAVIAGNSTIFNAIVSSVYPRLSVLAFVAGVTSVIALGSAITGFIFSAVARS